MALSDSTFEDIGGGVSSLFSGLGEFASAKAYTQASKINQSNALIAQNSANLNAALQQRNNLQAAGTIRASTASTGFELGGSAGDLLRMQTQQGALAKSLILQQGELSSQSYAAQAAAEQGQAAAAQKAGSGGLFGGLIKFAGGLSTLI